MSRRQLFLHVGASKTGTSALQRGLFDSGHALHAQGVGMPLASRHEHIRRVLRPLGWVTAGGFTHPVRPDRLTELGPRLSRTPGERLLLTCEDLCEADPDRIAALVSVARDAGHEVRVVLTVRGLASVVPSEWQQFLKHRMELDYPTFLERVRERRGRWAHHFWQRQDVPAICRRWGDAVGEDRLDVVVTPDRTTDPDGLYRTFGQVVGFDPAQVSWPTRNVNASWGYVEAEVYRRVNVSLGRDRLPRYERDYQPGLRWPLVQGVLPRSASARIPLPADQLDWVADIAREHVAWLRGSGIRVHGQLDRLVPTARDVGELPVLDEAAVGQAAIDTLANFAEFTWRRHQRVTTAAPARPRLLVRVRRRVGRLLGRQRSL
jgi:hypothetical protein